MSDPVTLALEAADAVSLSPVDRLRRALALRLVAGLSAGRLDLRLPDGSHVAHGGAKAGPAATLRLHRWKAVDRLLWRGEEGLVAAYLDGDVEIPDLGAFFDFALANEEALSRAATGNIFGRMAERLQHLVNRNSRRGSKANIAFHYDLGNDFYAPWLDRTMTYSAALFDGAEDDLAAAQFRKFDAICRGLDLKPGDRVLEIGCGWGGFALHAARRFGAHVHGVTLSREQLAYARAVVQDAGLDHLVTLELRDYRDLEGTYDHVVSIEMFEAVGQAWWQTYFERLSAVLKPGGRAFLQIITIAPDRFETYARKPDFIQLHIFPGGMLPTPDHVAALAGEAGLDALETRFDGEGYGRTLRIWRERFEAAWPDLERLRFDARFRRLWLYYLQYCEAGFRHGTIDLGRFLIAKPGRES